MRLGIFLPSWIGDTCMATPALRAIRDGLRDCQITAISRPGPAGLLKGSRFIDEWIRYQPRGSLLAGRRRLVCDLKAAKLDAVLLLTNSLGSAIIPWLAGIPRRIGYATDMRGLLLTERVAKNSRPPAGSSKQPLIESYLALAKALAIPADDRQMELPVDAEEQVRVRKILEMLKFQIERPLVVINNAAASAKSRIWPSQYVVHLCRQLVSDLGVQVILHSGPNDRAETNSVCSQVKSPWVQSMGEWPDLPLSLSVAVMARADVVLSTDSGPRHIAAALNRPVVSLFGPTDPQATRTFNRSETLLESFQECRPCYKTECPLKHHHCMRNIEVETVLQAIKLSLSCNHRLRIAG